MKIQPLGHCSLAVRKFLKFESFHGNTLLMLPKEYARRLHFEGITIFEFISMYRK